jgi:hypothetical protein
MIKLMKKSSLLVAQLGDRRSWGRTSLRPLRIAEISGQQKSSHKGQVSRVFHHRKNMDFEEAAGGKG